MGIYVGRVNPRPQKIRKLKRILEFNQWWYNKGYNPEAIRYILHKGVNKTRR